MTIVVRVAVRPPNRSAFTESNLRPIDPSSRVGTRHGIGPGRSYRPAGHHEFQHEGVALVRVKPGAYAAELLELEVPVVLTGDYNVMPTELDVYKPERWINDALFRIEVRYAFRQLVDQGWTDAIRTLHPHATIYTFWDYFRNVCQKRRP